MIRSAALLALLAPCALGCASGGAGGQTAADSPVGAGTNADSAGAGEVPAGYGTLRQDDIAVRMQIEGVQIKAIPLDESIIRMLSPDSYRALRELQESRRAQASAIARRYGAQQYDLWYVSFFAVAPEARFSPMEFIVTNNGRDFRPLDVVPLTPGWGEQRLKVRETQSALYIFDPSLDPSQPLTVRVESAQNDDWARILRVVERERALIRSRAARQP